MLIPAAAALLLLGAACSGGDTIVQSGAPQMGVSATGTGTAVGEPDVMLLMVGVSAERDSIDAAREAASSAQTAVIDALMANGVEEEDIQTVQFNVSPQYDFRDPDGERRITGYVVSNVVSAKVRDLERAGDVIDAATQAGGDDAVVQGVSFTIDDPTELRAQAREEAVNNARAQAEQLASNAGESLGQLLSISESGGFVPFFDARGVPSGVGGDVQEATPIQPGQLEVTVTVNVLYAIE